MCNSPKIDGLQHRRNAGHTNSVYLTSIAVTQIYHNMIILKCPRQSGILQLAADSCVGLRLGRRINGWEKSVEIDIKEMLGCGRGSSGSGQGPDAVCFVSVLNERSWSIKVR